MVSPLASLNWKTCSLVHKVSCFWKLGGQMASKKIVHAISFNVFQVGVSFKACMVSPLASLNYKTCSLVHKVSCFWKLGGPTAWTTSKK